MHFLDFSTPSFAPPVRAGLAGWASNLNDPKDPSGQTPAAFIQRLCTPTPSAFTVQPWCEGSAWRGSIYPIHAPIPLLAVFAAEPRVL